jgi:colanic acid/amylovoran biosynthesis glycosyltransferase
MTGTGPHLAQPRATGCPMRVAYVVNQYPALSHTFIRREIAALEATRLIQIARYSIRRGANGYVDPADQLEAARTFVVLDLGMAGLARATLMAAVRSPRRFFSALALAIRTGWGSDRGLLRHFAFFVEACALSAAFRRDGIEHVHAHFGTNVAAIAMFCRVLGGPPYSVTVHGPLEFDLAPLLDLRRKIARSDFIVAITHYCKSQLWRHCDAADRRKVHVVTCGVDGGFLKEEPTPVPSAPRLVFVGRFAEHKAPLLLIEAAARLLQKGVPFELTLAGDGELRPQIEQAISRAGLASRVRITGFVDEAGVRKHIREARALVLPSFAEGLPVVIMEALALGRPVVSTFVAGIPELVKPEQSGWLVPAGSVDHLAAAMQEALEAPVEQLERMGRSGRASVLERHDCAKSGGLLAQLFIDSRARTSHSTQPSSGVERLQEQ